MDKTMKVDFGNSYLRCYIEREYCISHRTHLDTIRGQLERWIARARADEAILASSLKRPARPLAVTLDIDEVILCNIHMNSFQAPAGGHGPDAIDFHAADYFRGPDGKPWPRTETRLNPLLPGARELLEYLHGQKIDLYLITGRCESIRDETIENFEFVGLAASDDAPHAVFHPDELTKSGGHLIMCPDAEYPAADSSIRPYKESARRGLCATRRIIMNIGDQVSDLGLYGDIQVLVPHPFYWIP